MYAKPYGMACGLACAMVYEKPCVTGYATPCDSEYGTVCDSDLAYEMACGSVFLTLQLE